MICRTAVSHQKICLKREEKTVPEGLLKLPSINCHYPLFPVSHTLSTMVSWLMATALRYKTDSSETQRRRECINKTVPPQVSKDNIKYRCSSLPMRFPPPFIGLCRVRINLDGSVTISNGSIWLLQFHKNTVGTRTFIVHIEIPSY